MKFRVSDALTGRSLAQVVWTCCLVVVSGCSQSSQSLPLDTKQVDLSKTSYSLYLNRASLSSQEFEQYKALPQGLFIECGTVHRGRAQVREQGIQSSSSERQLALKAMANEIYQLLKSSEAPHVDSPGTGAGLADPGKFTLVVTDGPRQVEVRTSLDWVERQQTGFSRKLNGFATELRGVAPKSPCGNEEFYGIGRVASN
jgi:hypothetical protein